MCNLLFLLLLLFCTPHSAMAQGGMQEYDTLDTIYQKEDSTLQAARMALFKDSTLIDEYQKIITIYKKRGEYDRELEIARQAARANPSSAVAYFMYGDAQLDNGMVPEAIETLENALVIDPVFVRARTTLAEAYTMIDSTTLALAQLDTAIAHNTRNAQSYMQKALLLTKLGRTPEAVSSYRMWSELLPGSFKAWLQLGLALKEVGEYEEAAEILHYTTTLNPNSPDALYAYAETSYLLGNTEEAGAAYRTFFLTFPTDPRALAAETAAREMHLLPEE